jgi:hypothetical protein
MGPLFAPVSRASTMHTGTEIKWNLIRLRSFSQALEAKEQGIADVGRLLSSPEDLGRLEQYRTEVRSKRGM